MHAWRSLSFLMCFLGLLQTAAAQNVALPLPAVQRQVFTGSFLERTAEQKLGIIVDSDSDNLISQPGDHVRVRCPAVCNLSVGDGLYAFAQSGTIRHPVSHEAMGVITDATGMLIVTEVQDTFVWAKVVKSFVEIERGQSVAKLLAPLYQDITPKRPNVSVEGHVLAIADALLLGREQRTLFVDRGRADGLWEVALGDAVIAP